LAYDLAPDLHTATGTETVRFTPDQQVCELNFRTWTDAPVSVAAGAALAVTAASVDDRPVAPRTEPAGAPPGAPGTLVTLPLPACVPAGGTVTARLDFRLTLGADAEERAGYSPDAGVAWFGSAFPMLAWVRGQGWVRDPAVAMAGETATSEEFQLDALRVTADETSTVAATGSAGPTSSPAPGRATSTFTAPSVRDVAVSVGNYALAERRVGDVTVHLATPRSGTRADPDRWLEHIGTALGSLQQLLGPYPYPDLWVTVVPGQNDGVEFPTAVQVGDVRDREIPGLVAHEIAHQWFYSLVGDNQAREPWLDEAFTTFAQAVVTGTERDYALDKIPDRLDGRLGAPMAYWAANGGFDAYERGVYDQGAATLLAARNSAGPDRFDAALRAYITANAHRVATPDDVRAAFADIPGVDELLTARGAFG
jgi:hypothetical protein